MANKCDKMIYGMDENSYASKIASDALSVAKGEEEYWGGSAIDQDGQAKGNAPNAGAEVVQRPLSKDSGGKRSEGN